MTIDAITAVTERIIERSKPSREAYLDRVRAAAESGPHRSGLSYGLAGQIQLKDALERAL